MGRAGRPATKPIQPGREWALRIRQARGRAGKEREDLASHLGKSLNTISDYETGKTEPDLTAFVKLGELLKVSPWWLAFGKPDESEPGGAPLFSSEEKDRLFAWTVHRAARLLADEGLDGDLAFLAAYARKLMGAAQGVADEAEAKELIARAIDAERAEFRQRKNDIRQDRL